MQKVTEGFTPLDLPLDWGTTGPLDAKIMIVGEAWGRDEHEAGKPFVGASGKELDRLLAEANIKRRDCFCTNVVSSRPPDNDMWHFFQPRKGASVEPFAGLHPTPLTLKWLTRLNEQLNKVRPALILAVGNYALWALTDAARVSYSSAAGGRMVPSGIMDFRGSMLWYRDYPRFKVPVLPIIHPAAIMRDWTKRDVTRHDLITRVPQALSEDWLDKWPAHLVGSPSASRLRD